MDSTYTSEKVRARFILDAARVRKNYLGVLAEEVSFAVRSPHLLHIYH